MIPCGLPGCTSAAGTQARSITDLGECVFVAQRFVCFPALILLLWLISLPARGNTPPKGATPPQTAPAKSGNPPKMAPKLWTGDLDGMVTRRVIRILVPCSKLYYFVDRGTQLGLAFDSAKAFEADLNKRQKNKVGHVNVILVPVRRDELIPGLIAGKGDIAMGNLTVTSERLKQVDFTQPVLRNVAEIAVTAPGSLPLTRAEELSGREVYVRPSSSFMDSLKSLNGRLSQAKRPPVRIRPAPEVLEEEDILEMVAAGLVPATIVDAHVAEFWQKVFPTLVLHGSATLRTGGEIGWMIRKDCPQLKAALNTFLSRYPEGSLARNQIIQKYFQKTKWVKAARSKEELAKFERTVELFRKYSARYDLDYLLMLAEGYQESRLDQNARSSVGAIGVMQLMLATGREMQVGDITQIEPNIHAGIKYLRFIRDKYFAAEPMDQLNKGLFTSAAYNAGPSRIQELRRLAAGRGLDPNRWFNHVELVAAERIGRETVQYVSNVYKYYLAYHLVMEQRREREAIRPPRG